MQEFHIVFSVGQGKLNIQSFLKWSCVFLIIGSGVKNLTYYPSFFDLNFLFEGFSDRFFGQFEGDVSGFIELYNRNVSNLLTALLLLSIIAIFGKRNMWLVRIFQVLGWLSLAFLFFTNWYFQGFQFAFLLEKLLQLSLIPLFIWSQISAKNLSPILLKLCALTFAGHGLYALNIFPRPAYFVDMVMKSLFLNEASAIVFLQVIGVLDLLVIFAIYIKPIKKWVLFYLIIWGFLTTLARPLLNVSWVFLNETLLIWIPEFLIRTSHFLIPLALYFQWKKESEDQDKGIESVEIE